MTFQWREFLDNHGIDYGTERERAGWLNITCPFCPDDPGKHLGLHESGAFSCFRDPTHKGRNVPKLINALLGVGWSKANELAGDWKEPATADLDALALQLDGLQAKPIDTPQPLRYPTSDFLPIRDKGATLPFWRYLIKRGFTEGSIGRLIADYKLTAALSGKWRNRLILPFIGRKQKIYGWQGRALSKSAHLRYVSHPDSSQVKQILFNYGLAFESELKKVLVIVEGAFGVLKCDAYGRRKGIRAVGTLGVSFTPAQVSLLFTLAGKYERTLILFDPGAESSAWDLAGRLSMFNPDVGTIPDGLTGPDEISLVDIIPFIINELR